MNFLQQQKLVISTLTPVHIGTGEDYEPGNYIIDKGYLYAFDASVLAGQLTEQQSKQLSDIVNKEYVSLAELQDFFNENADLSKAISNYTVPLVQGFEYYYKQRIGKGGNKLQIERTCQNHHNYQYYLPGSSLKGAIRNCLISILNTQKELTEQQRRNIDKSFQPRDFELKSIRRECKTLHFTLEKLLKYDVGQKKGEDILKFLKCSDLLQIDRKIELPLSEIVFCVNQKIKQNKKANGPTQLLEVIPENRYRSFYCDIRLFNDKTEQLISKNLFNFKEIAKIVNQFHIPKFLIELENLHRLSILPENWYHQISSLMTGKLKKYFDNGSIMLLRLGKHGGAKSKTVDGIRQIEISFTNENKEKKKTILTDSSTIWLKSNSDQSEKNMLPFGWILLESFDSPEIEELKNFMLEQTQSLRTAYKNDKKFQKNQRQQIIENLVKVKEANEKKETLAKIEKKDQEQKQKDKVEAEQEKEREKQKKISQLTKNLSPLGIDFMRKNIEQQWEEKKEIFTGGQLIEGLLDELESDKQKDAINILKDLFNKHFPHLLKDPEATQGKNKKPKFKPRQKNIAKKLLALIKIVE